MALSTMALAAEAPAEPYFGAVYEKQKPGGQNREKSSIRPECDALGMPLERRRLLYRILKTVAMAYLRACIGKVDVLRTRDPQRMVAIGV
jgi:hypothetical protein